MNWAKGAFRVWVIFTVTWLGFATWDIYGDRGPRIAELTNLMRKLELNDRDLQIEVTREKGDFCLSVDRKQTYCDLPVSLLNQIDYKKLMNIDPEDYWRPPDSSGPKYLRNLRLVFDENAYQAARMQADAAFKQAVAGLRYQDMKVYVAQKLRDSRSEAVKEALGGFSLFGFLPPLGLLGSWFLGIWILRGFRPRT